ncbi:hypothetical protein ABEO87_00645 [Geobacillus stearothermophilus]|nr:hypothetical protein [Geobacillus sp. DSP4a]KZE90104.1 hypothetical protein AVP43_03355 [Geobacillus stearothermophilus]MED4302172.1 hypothetical protein [Geobacillus stearothermophilus]WJP99251.1 hypothetical protein QT234_11225 [Geobacillus stearothermophilus]WJQ15302.1 hypothetical protein QT238_06950 [Geobacillus stearothermophilus]
MSVLYNPQTKQFHLRAGKASYVMQLFRSGYWRAAHSATANVRF